MLRIGLFLITNFAILFLFGIVARIFGLQNSMGQDGYMGLLVFAAMLGFGGSFVSLFMSKWLAKKSMGVQIIEHPSSQSEQWLVDTIARQTKQAGISMPEVGIYHGAPNAFATGANRNNALIAVSDGLLNAMSADEVEAVLAHEVSHAANGDMVTLTLIQGVVNTFVIFFSEVIGRFIDRAILKNNSDSHGIGYYVGTMVAQILLSILATMVVMWFSRYREYRADYGAAKISGKEKMIAALQKLQHLSNGEPLPDKMAAFGIAGGKVMNLFSSHPPLEKRIAALRAL